MDLELNGLVKAKRSGSGVSGASVVVLIETTQNKPLRYSKVTAEDGQFSFEFPEKLVARWKKAKATARIAIEDRSSQALYKGKRHGIGKVVRFDIELDDKKVDGADLPKLLGSGGLIPSQVFETIETAIATSAPPQALHSFQAIGANLFCRLPPLFNLGDVNFTDLAGGLLAGRSEARRWFDNYLSNFEIWNQQRDQTPPQRLSAKEAEALLSKANLTKLRRQIEQQSTGESVAVLPVAHRARLIFAALQSSGGDPVKLHRALGILDRQMAAVRSLERLYEMADAVLAGDKNAQGVFLQSLRTFGGGCGPELPGPGDLGDFFPLPAGGPFWPPNPVPGRGPFDIPDRADMWACIAEAIPEWAEGIRSGRLFYQIDSIEPENACPGQQITIRGRDLKFGDLTSWVRFPGPDGTVIEVEADESAEDRIVVTVPEGARCGDIELTNPEARRILVACGVEETLFPSPRVPFHFNGGETAITSFGHSPEVEGCWYAGETLHLGWRVCNTESVRLLVVHPDGETVLVRETLPPSLSHYTYAIPELSLSGTLAITLAVEGPCGEDSRRLVIHVHRKPSIDLAEVVSFQNTSWENWHHDLARPSIGIAEVEGETGPEHLESVIKAVLTAERFGQKLGVEGSAWSYSPCVVPRRSTHLLLRTSNMALNLTNLTDGAGRPGHIIPAGLRDDDELRSILPAATLARITPTPTLVRNRLVHVEAGIKIHRLNCLLDNMVLAMPTLGGANGQSIVGAVSTCTHGANPDLPPIVDFIRAIHLVGTGGQQWWLEPARNPITRRDRMLELMDRGVLDPCIKLVYDDQLFDACLVSFGCAGIIYSVVIEAVDRHNLRKDTVVTNWDTAKERIRGTVLDRTVLAPWFFEVSTNPTKRAWLTTYAPTSLPRANVASDQRMWSQMLREAFLDDDYLGRAIEAFSQFILERLTQPWRALGDAGRDIRLLFSAYRAMVALHALLDVHHFHRRLADLLVEVMNFLWKIGSEFALGKEIVQKIQNIATHAERIATRPGEPVVAKSYEIMTNQKDCRGIGYETPGEHSEWERKIQSSEFILPDRPESLDFVDRLLDIASSFDRSERGLILILNLRYTLASRALLAMQQYNRSFHVEVWTVKGMEGNPEFHRQMRALAREFGAIPHWGHFHEDSLPFNSLYTVADAYSGRVRDKVALWEQAMNRIALGGAGNRPNTFRHDFALRRGLLSDL